METRELDQIRAELNSLHTRSNDNKVAIATLEAVNEQRYENILECLEKLRKDYEAQSSVIAELQAVATEGRSSLRTLLWVGGLVSGIITLYYTMISK